MASLTHSVCSPPQLCEAFGEKPSLDGAVKLASRGTFWDDVEAMEPSSLEVSHLHWCLCRIRNSPLSQTVAAKARAPQAGGRVRHAASVVRLDCLS